MEAREKFEALPDVAIIFEGLHPTIIWFCKTANRYATSFSGFDNKVVWLNGAWHAFQEQQKIINMQECGAKQIIEILNDFNSSEKPASFYLRKIQELLE